MNYIIRDDGVTFALGDSVTITNSGEKGELIGLATFKHNVPQGLLHFCRADGCSATNWFDLTMLELSKVEVETDPETDQAPAVKPD